MWASFNLDAINNFTNAAKENIAEVIKGEGETVLPFGNHLFSMKDVKQMWNVKE